MRSRRTPAFDIQALLGTSGVADRVMEYGRGEVIFSQGDASDSVMYIRNGAVTLSVRSRVGKEAVVAVLGQGEFFGEGCLAGQARRKQGATAIAQSTIQVIGKADMARLLHEQRALSDRFTSHLLTRHIRVEGDLIDQLFDSSEKQLARALLRLAGFGTQDQPRRVLASIPQGTLAGMAGTSRSRINSFMNKFERLGFIDRGRGSLTIDDSLLNVVLHD